MSIVILIQSKLRISAEMRNKYNDDEERVCAEALSMIVYIVYNACLH